MQILFMLTVSLNLGLLLAAPAILPRVAFDRYSPEVLIGQQPLSSSSPVVRPASGPNAAIHPIALVTDQLSTNRRGWSYEDSSEISEASRSLRKREPPRNQVEKLKQFEARIAKDLSSDDYGYDWVHENAVDKFIATPGASFTDMLDESLSEYLRRKAELKGGQVPWIGGDEVDKTGLAELLDDKNPEGGHKPRQSDDGKRRDQGPGGKTYFKQSLQEVLPSIGRHFRNINLGEVRAAMSRHMPSMPKPRPLLIPG